MAHKYDFKLPRDWPTTIGNRLCLLGTSEDGPYMEPTVVRDKSHARSLFGSEDVGNLVKAFDQAYDINEDISIYLMRISGKNATLDIEGIYNEQPDIYEDDRNDTYIDDTLKYCLRFATTRGGAKYNDYSVWAVRDEEQEMYLFYLQLSKTEQIVYKLPSYMTIGAFAKEFNGDCRLGRHHVMLSTDYPELEIEAILHFLEPIFVDAEPEEEPEEESEDDEPEEEIDFSGLYIGSPEPDFTEEEYIEDEDEDYTEDPPIASDPGIETAHFLSGGEDGTTITKNDLYLACDVAYSLLQGRAFDIVVPVEMYVDDVHPAWLYGTAVYGSAYYSSTSDYLQLVDTQDNNKVVSFHEQLIEFCREQMRLGFMSHGVIGLRPFKKVPEDIESTRSYVSRLAQSTAFKNRHGFTDYANGAWYDKGYFVSVVGMDLLFYPQRSDKYHANGSVRYGALLAGNYDSTTNMQIGEDVELRYELSDSTIQELSNIGVVTFRDSVRKGLVVSSGITASSPQNELHGVSNVRMVQIAIAYMNEAVELVYENDYDAGMRKNFLEQEVRTRLDILSQLGILTAYDYSIIYRADGIKGEILLTLQSKHTVEAIQTSAEITYREA